MKNLINLPSVSQFLRKNAMHDYGIFKDIFYYLVNKTNRRHDAARFFKHILPIKIIDSVVILVVLKLEFHLKMDEERAEIKGSTLFNGEYPEKNIAKEQLSLLKYFS